jgi:hypothetical protein
MVGKYNIQQDRFEEFSFLQYLNVDDYYVDNYLQFYLGLNEPDFKHRLSSHLRFWDTLNAPGWILDIIKSGVKIPFEKKPHRMLLQNNRTVLADNVVPQIRQILREYLEAGFITVVKEVPFCVLPLQLRVQYKGVFNL